MNTHSHNHASSPQGDAETSTAPSAISEPREVFCVVGMNCSDEITATERALKRLSSVHGLQADIFASKVTVVSRCASSPATLRPCVTNPLPSLANPRPAYRYQS
jgi:hypothetical protein